MVAAKPLRKSAKATRQRELTFVLEYFQTAVPGQSAITAGYSPHTADAQASKLLKKPRVQARLAELRARAEDAAIISVTERKKRLSELAREEVITSKGQPMRQSNIAAITELNRMEMIGTPRQPQQIGAVHYNFMVPDAQTREVIGHILAGERRMVAAPPPIEGEIIVEQQPLVLPAAATPPETSQGVESSSPQAQQGALPIPQLQKTDGRAAAEEEILARARAHAAESEARNLRYSQALKELESGTYAGKGREA